MTFLQGKASSCIWSILIRRSLYADHGIHSFEQGSYYEGFQTLSRLIYYSRVIACTDAYLYHYNRLNPNSIVMNVPNNIEIQKQGLFSILGVCVFFQSHESCYYDMVKRLYITYIYRILNINCCYRNKKRYKEFLNQLENVDSNYRSLIGWNRPWKRVIDNSYYLNLLFFIVKRIKRKTVSVLKRKIVKK